jgi:TRAP-type C4-dicarboxylate transport system permease small subunit
MRRAMDLIEHVIGACAAFLLLLFTVLILFDIVCRYWLHIPLSWPTELTVLLFQWTAFLGAAIALRRGSHFGLSLLVDAVPPAARRILRWFILIVMLAGSALLISVSLDMIAQQKFSSYPTLPFSHATAYYGVLLSAGLMILFTLEQMMRGPAPGAEAQ